MRIWFHIATLAITVSAAQQALAADPMAGEVLAEVWCASCHNVGPEDVASDAAPSFYMIVNVEQRSANFLTGWLVNPHGAMPDPNLTRTEIEDIVSYMETIRVP